MSSSRRFGVRLTGLIGSAVILGSFALVRPAHAEMIGVQFYSTGTGSAGTTTAPSSALTPSQTAGVPSDSTNGNASYLQSNWNAIGVASPGTIAFGSVSSSGSVDSTGSANSLSATMAYQSGDIGGSHKGGAYNTEVGSSIANPNGAGYNQASLLGATLADNSSSDSSLVQFSNLPTSGYTYEVVAYTEMYGTTGLRLQVGGTALLAGNATYAEGTPTLTGPGGFGTNPTTGTDQVYVTQQAGPSSGSAVTTGDTDYTFDGSTFVTSPIAYTSTGTTLPTTASNYVIWTGVTPDSSGNLIVSWNKYTSAISPAPPTTVEGVSAVQLIATPVPEPVGLSVLAVGGLAMALRRRRSATH